ncbi:tape measure protein [uncultured Streptococcus sp.]|uniref:tape measure protein n=1 Tax=uncultured Streptococcus sp. TaxID=83427 RepID=UPI0028D25CB7|nr:tape measure protein [uncultured Streptococcus sp.]
MANIQTTMSLTDRVTGTLNKIYATMERVKNAGSGIDKAMKAQESAMKKAGDSGQYFVNKAGRVIDINGRFVNSATLAAAGLKKEELALIDLGNASNNASNKLSKLVSLKGLLKTALAGIAVGAITKQAIGMSDEYANMHARLDMIRDGMQTTEELQKSIYTSAQRTGSAYTTMANGVAKMRMQAGDVFQNNGETIAFLETMNKSFVVGGASIEEQKSAMLQLTQAMASGKLQGDELRSLAETSPALIQAIANKLGVSRGEVKKLGADGKITADIVKTAMLDASEAIDQQFRNMPMTWGRAWQNFLNFVTKAFEPISIKINQIVNSSAFQQFAQIVATVLQYVVQAVIFAMDMIGAVWSMLAPIAQFVIDNWSVIQPIIIAVAFAIGTYVVAMNAARIATGLFSIATNVAKAAMAGLNAVMAMNPIMLIVMAVIILIGLFYALVAWFNNLTGAAVSATGIIIGAIFYLGMTIWNILLSIANAAIWVINMMLQGVFWYVNTAIAFWMFLYQAILTILIGILDFIDWFVTGAVNLWNEMSFQVQSAWYDIAQGGKSMAVAIAGFVDSMVNSVISSVEGMINSVLSGFNSMIGFLNGLGLNISAVGSVSLGRTNFAGDVASAIGDMQKPVKKSFEGLHLADGLKQHKASLETPHLDTPQLGYLELGDRMGAFNKGYEIGQGIDKAVGGFFKGAGDANGAGNNFLGDQGKTPYELSPASSVPGQGDGGKGGGGGHNPTGGKLDKVGKIEDEIKLDDEYIKLIKDVATMKWQQNFITLKPEIVTNIDSINNAGQYANVLDDLNATIVDALNNGADGLMAY